MERLNKLADFHRLVNGFLRDEKNYRRSLFDEPAEKLLEVYDDRLHYEYDRHSKRQKRTKNEIGIHSIRGGTIVGEHDVIFAGHDEVITLSHSATSKGVFAAGAVKAAKFVIGKKPGLYQMSDVITVE